jgi:hypothetical protein
LFVGAVDGGGFGERAHVEIEQGPQALGRLEREFRAVRDLTADVIGQAAVGEGNIGTTLDENDVRALGMAPRAGRGGGSAGHTADDDNGFWSGFHLFSGMLKW